jgi:hypothetical protein
MTAPVSSSAREANWILGANLREFLNLGSEIGYFHLGAIHYDEDVARALQAGRQVPVGLQGNEDVRDFRSELENDELEALDRFRKDLDLQPWPEVTMRLAQLQATFKGTLRFKEQLD